MRVTNKMLSNNFLRDMRTNLNNMKTLQEQMASGKEIRKPSDDPFKVARSMQLNTDINTNKQYNENISDTINWLDTTDTALNQAGNVLQRVRELLVSAGNAGYDNSQRGAIKDEINQKIGELSQILNTNFDGKYVFGGSRGTTKPVDVTNPTTCTIGDVTSPSGAATGTITGSYTGTDSAEFKITTNVDTSVTPNKLKSVSIQKSTDNGSTWGTASTVALSTPLDTNGSTSIDLGNGLKFNIDGTTNTIQNAKDYTFNVSVKKGDGNSELFYYNKNDGTVLPETTKVSIDQANINTNWGGKVIRIDDGTGATKDITLDSSFTDINDLAKNINDKITTAYTTGKEPIKAVIEDNQLRLVNLTDNHVKIENNGDATTFPTELSSFDGKEVSDYQKDMIGSGLSSEISKGVTMEYSVTATDILQYTNEKGEVCDLRELFNAITSHLDGKQYNSTSALYKDNTKYQDSQDSSYTNATSASTNKDLQGITDAINNLLKVRSGVGAKQNRMDSAKEKNSDENSNMTEMLSKTEDIDITEKTMEFATMQTVYIASLQTSAKVIQPSLMDYLR